LRRGQDFIHLVTIFLKRFSVQISMTPQIMASFVAVLGGDVSDVLQLAGMAFAEVHRGDEDADQF
jgi:hypothetical protein